MGRVGRLLGLHIGFALAAAGVVRAQASRSTTPLVRSVALPSGTVTLGTPLGWASRYLSTAIAGVVRVPGDSAIGLRDVKVGLRPSERVQRITITYDTTAEMGAVLSEYRMLMGPPADSVVRTRFGSQAVTWTWRDERTSVAVTRYTPALRGGVLALSELRDLTL